MRALPKSIRRIAERIPLLLLLLWIHSPSSCGVAAFLSSSSQTLIFEATTRPSANKSFRTPISQTRRHLWLWSTQPPPYSPATSWAPDQTTNGIVPNENAQPDTTPPSANQGDSSTEEEENHGPFPEVSSHGVYQIKTEEQYYNFIKANPTKLVVIKFFATYCRACRSLEPKLLMVKKDEKLNGLPIVWGEYASTKANKDLFQQLRVLTLPTIHFYDGSRATLVENFPCGPAKIPLLKKKLARFINSRVDPDTLKLEPVTPVAAKDQTKNDETESLEARVTRRIIDNELITPEHFDFLRNKLPFFRDMPENDFDLMLSKAKLLTFDPNDIIIRQGSPGTTFFVLKSGIAEMSVLSRKYDNPISTASDYLGVVVNELKQFDYFGERALTTGEPYCASVRVLDKVRCFAFEVEDIPETSILSKKRRATEEYVEYLSQRYRVKTNPPKDAWSPAGPIGNAQSWSTSGAAYASAPYPVPREEQCVLELLVQFRRIRQAAICFAYIMQSEPNWGDQGEIARRSMLVRKLSPTQKQEFLQVFDMVDKYGRNKITLLRMRKFMESARNKSNEEMLREIKANPLYKNQMALHMDYPIGRDEFLGLMAEAEFYNLFKETFQELDKDSTGYVRAGELDEVLGNVRDLVSVDYSAHRATSTIIDVHDEDMLVDYEQFSKILLGAAL